MKRSFYITLILSLVSLFSMGQAQYPIVQFNETPGTHNMHIASDGYFLYTVNGGRSDMGQISKYTLQGEYVATYAIPLDMRGIFFYYSRMYVSTYEGDLYEVSNVKKGKYKLFLDDAAAVQSNITLIPGTNDAVSFDGYSLKYINLKTKAVRSRSVELQSGTEFSFGMNTVAANEDYLFTFDALGPEVYVYTHDCQFVRSFSLAYGDYGFSLSYADGKVWTANDGNYGEGTWYGFDLGQAMNSEVIEEYEFDDLSGDEAIHDYEDLEFLRTAIPEAVYVEPKATLSPIMSFDEDPGTHNMGLGFDGKQYYTVNGGVESEGAIRTYSSKLELLGSYSIDLDMRSVLCNGLGIFISTYAGGIYRITDLHAGEYEEVIPMLWEDPNASAAFLSTGDIVLMSFGELFKIGSEQDLKAVYTGLRVGQEANTGNASVAASDRYIFSFDGDSGLLYVYDYNLNYIETYQLEKGRYGFSLSYANGMLWVAKDGDYSTGTWYAYRIP